MLVRAGVGGGVCSNSWYCGAADAPASVALSELGLVPLSGVPVAVTAGPGLTGRPGELCREQAGDTLAESQGAERTSLLSKLLREEPGSSWLQS